jgi:hypothetical protein
MFLFFLLEINNNKFALALVKGKHMFYQNILTIKNILHFKLFVRVFIVKAKHKNKTKVQTNMAYNGQSGFRRMGSEMF